MAQDAGSGYELSDLLRAVACHALKSCTRMHAAYIEVCLTSILTTWDQDCSSSSCPCRL